jgi:hypothetical protein
VYTPSCPDNRCRWSFPRCFPRCIARKTSSPPVETGGEQVFYGADDEIRTRDPHLGKAMNIVRAHLLGACGLVAYAASSGQSAESHPIPASTYNAFNLYRSHRHRHRHQHQHR